MSSRDGKDTKADQSVGSTFPRRHRSEDIQIHCFVYNDLARITEAYTQGAGSNCNGTHDDTIGDGV